MPVATAGQALARLIKWYFVGARMFLGLAADRARGQASLRRVGARLRRAFETMGATAVKLGQQLSLRVDMLPPEICQELSKLTDRAPPMLAEEAIVDVERAIGGPLSSVFAAFDPDPVGSASLACVYKARLLSGGEVAVKVQRRGVARRFAADLFVFGAMTRLIELLSAVPPGFFQHMRSELRAMFMEETDFIQEARYQALFRWMSRKDGLGWLTAPRVFRSLSTDTVLVSEFVSGVPCSELLAAVETGDQEALATFRGMDIDPSVVAERIFLLQFWGRFEAMFFHGDPHPANIMVLPGSRVCMLDFGACGVISAPVRLIQQEIVHRMLADDVTAVAALGVATLDPLPAMDTDAFRRENESHFWKFQQGMRDPRSTWAERATGGLWMSLAEVAQRHKVPVNMNALRLMRATMLYDTVACRLDPKQDLRTAERYFREAAARKQHRLRRDRARAGRGLPPGARALLRSRERREALQDLLWRARLLSATLVPSYQRLAGKGALVARFALLLLPLVVALFLVRRDLGAMLVVANLIVFGLYRLRHRLQDVDA